MKDNLKTFFTWGLKSKLLLGVFILIVGTVVLYWASVDVDLMVKNQSGERVVITSCSLNGTSIPRCEQELLNEQSVFFNPEHSFYPENNNFSLQVKLSNGNKELSCKFKKISRECIAEVALTKEGLFCADCISIY